MPTIACEASFRPLAKCCRRIWRPWRSVARRIRLKSFCMTVPSAHVAGGFKTCFSPEWKIVCWSTNILGMVYTNLYSYLFSLTSPVSCFLCVVFDLSSWNLREHQTKSTNHGQTCAMFLFFGTCRGPLRQIVAIFRHWCDLAFEPSGENMIYPNHLAHPVVVTSGCDHAEWWARITIAFHTKTKSPAFLTKLFGKQRPCHNGCYRSGVSAFSRLQTRPLVNLSVPHHQASS